jgi:hypothetical protein
MHDRICSRRVLQTMSSRKGGRKPLVPGEKAIPVSSALPRELYDRVCYIATYHKTTPSAIVRHAVKKLLKASSQVSA